MRLGSGGLHARWQGRSQSPCTLLHLLVSLLVYWQATWAAWLVPTPPGLRPAFSLVGRPPCSFVSICSADTVALQTLPQVRESSFQPLSRSCLPAPFFLLSFHHQQTFPGRLFMSRTVCSSVVPECVAAPRAPSCLRIDPQAQCDAPAASRPTISHGVFLKTP